MPYTLAHPIAVAPVWYLFGKKVPLSALVIGSLSPDFPYFIHLTPVHAPGHSLSGLIIYCLPASLLALTIWHGWIEQPIAELARLPLSSKIHFNLPTFYLVVTGVLIGAGSHGLWDAATHHDGWFVERTSWLSNSFMWLPVYKWLQYTGSVFGSLGVLVWYLLSITPSSSATISTPRYWLAGITFCLSLLTFVALANSLHDSTTIRQWAVRSATGAVVGLFMGSLIYASIVRLSSQHTDRRN